MLNSEKNQHITEMRPLQIRGVQQPLPESQTPGVQSQQPQGPPPTTTPPVHTPPQEMGKQAHLQAQSLQQGIYVANQTRPASQRHQDQDNRWLYQRQPTVAARNIFGYAPAPTPQNAAFYLPPQVGSPFPVGQGAGVVQQGGIQQLPQLLQAMALPLGQTDVYQGHIGGGQNSANNSARNRKQRRRKAVLDVVDPKTGKNISEEIYDYDAATQSGGSSNRATPQRQNCGMEMIADFAARDAKAATEESDSGSPAPSSAPDSHESLISSINTTQSVLVQAGQSAQTVTGVKPKEHKPRNTAEEPKEQQCSTKKLKRTVVHQLMLSLREDIATWKTESPNQGESSDFGEEDIADLYERLQRTLNKMHNHSEKHLQGSVDLIFEKAVNEPKLISVCALLCKKFAIMRVTVPMDEVGNEKHIIDFQSLIIKRCLMEFEDARDKNRGAILKHDIGASETSGSDGYWQTLTAEERRSRTKSFRNVRFMGELFKQRILTSLTVWECGQYLLTQIEDESLECFCHLLSSVGKDLESGDVDLESQFDRISDIVDSKTPNNISPRVIRMLQSLIELRKNKWITPGSEIVDLKDEEEDKDTPTGPPPFEHTYSVDQQSPLDMSGRRVYDREFLLELRTKPSSKIRPSNLPDESIVLKDNSRKRGAVDIRHLKHFGVDCGHPFWVPGMVKSRGQPPKRGNQQGNPKLTKQNVIKVSLSLKEDAEVREIENVGNSSGITKPKDANEEEIKTESLYEELRKILDTLSPQTLTTSLNLIPELRIDSLERLQYLIDLVCEKAIDKPDYYRVYALMCEELARVHFSRSDTGAGKKESNVNFRKLFIDRRIDFEKNTVDENARAIKMKEIEACPDPDKKKELLHVLDEEETKNKVKSVCNIRFIGELFQLGMLTTNIMHRSISQLLTQIDEESLEHLCTLLMVIGKNLESGGQSLDGYFEQMLEFVNRKGPMKSSLRVRFRLQYLIDLRSNNWISIANEGNPKTSNKTATESIIKSPDVKVNNTPTNIVREDSQNNEGEGLNITEKNMVHFPLPEIELQRYIPTKATKQKKGHKKDDSQLIKECELKPLMSLDFSEFRNKFPITDDLRSGNKNTLKSSGTVSADASKVVTPNKFAELKDPPGKQAESALPLSGSFNVHLAHRTAIIIEEYLSCTGETSIRNTALTIRETYDDVTFVNFVRELLNSAVQKSAIARKRVGQLMMHLISVNILPLPLYLAGLTEVLDNAEDLVICIPQIWVYLAELIWYPLAEGVHPFGELKTTMSSLKSKGLAGELMVELTIVLVQEKTPKWLKEQWDQSGLQWRDFLPEGGSADFVDEFESDFLVVVSRSASSRSMKSQLSMEDICEQLIQLMSHEKKESLTDITKWISVHVGERVIESEFVKVLMTAILETSIEPYNETWEFRVDKFRNLRSLIPRYIDVSIKLLELQFLISIQEYKDQLEHPQSIHLQTIEKQTIESIVSFDVFNLLENNDNRRPVNRKLLAILALKSFFTSLKRMGD